MSSQPETNTFPDIYQWETTDPILGGAGGVANLPLLQLTARTRYLLGQIEATDQVLGSLAPIASPVLSGTPLAPTPATGAGGSEIATAQFARTLVGGTVGIDVSGGNHAMSVQEAGFGILAIGGTPAADVFVLLPNVGGKWSVINSTARRVTMRQLAGGFAVSVLPGSTKTVFSDGANTFPVLSDFENVVLAGAPTTPTAPDGDSSALVCNTAFVARALADNNSNLSPGSIYGYQKYPSGLISQFGVANTVSGLGDYYPFPIAYPNGFLAGVAGEANALGWGLTNPSPSVFGMNAGRNSSEFRLFGAKIPSGSSAGQTPYWSGGISFFHLSWGF